MGDNDGAVTFLTRAADGGYLLPEAWQHAWVAGLVDRAAVGALRVRAEAGKEEAEGVFREAGGPELLGLPA